MSRIEKMVELARAHVEAGGMNSAGVYYRMILKDTSPPKTGVERLARGEACVWYARKSLAENRLGTATDWYRQAIAADPLAVDYRVEYCIRALLPMNLLKNARIEAETATKIDPKSKNAWRALGGLEHALGNAQASIAAYDKQIELDPSDVNAKMDRATIALDMADYTTVRGLCLSALSGDRCGDALQMMAMAAYREGNHEEAINLYDMAIASNCHDTPLAEWNKSLALHSIGRYAEGWKAHEARGRQTTDQAMRFIMNRFAAPIWSGEPPPARLHVHQEMGHGDVIAMARYVPLLAERGYDVRLEVGDSMLDLMRRSFPRINVMAKAADYPGAVGIPLFDYHIPMLSLPERFGTDIDTVPWSGPYLKTDPALVKKFDGLLPEGRRIGICWSSGIRNEGLWLAEYGRRKSVSFATIAPIINDSDVFVSLQVGPEAKDCRDPVISVLPEQPSWDETAALIECLDLVITVDTSVAHMAGALGKPLWVMMHTEGSWHWMTQRLDSPWYPSARLFRQEKQHEWGGVVQEVGRSLLASDHFIAASQPTTVQPIAMFR